RAGDQLSARSARRSPTAAAQARALAEAHARGDRAAHLVRLSERAAELAARYWEHHCRQQGPVPHPSALSPVSATTERDRASARVRSLPAIAPDFGPNSDRALIPAALPIHAVLAAYSNAQSGATAWLADATQLPTFTYAQPSGTTSVQVRPTIGEPLASDRVIQALREQVVRRFSDLDGDVFLSLLAQAMTATPPPAASRAERAGQRSAAPGSLMARQAASSATASTWITSATVLDFRGIRPMRRDEHAAEDDALPQRRGHRRGDLEEGARWVGRVRNTWVTTHQAIVPASLGQAGAHGGKGGEAGTRSRRRRLLQSRQSPLVVIHEVIRERDLGAALHKMPGQQVQESLAVAWRYEIGAWL